MELKFSKFIRDEINLSEAYESYYTSFRWRKEALGIMNTYINRLAVHLVKSDNIMNAFKKVYPNAMFDVTFHSVNEVKLDESFAIGLCRFLVKKYRTSDRTSDKTSDRTSDKTSEDRASEDLGDCLRYVVRKIRTKRFETIDSETLLEKLKFFNFEFNYELKKNSDYIDYTMDCKSIISHFLRKHKKKMSRKTMTKINIFINVMGKYLTRESISGLGNNSTITPFYIQAVVKLMMTGINVENFMLTHDRYKIFKSAMNGIKKHGPYEVTDLLNQMICDSTKHVTKFWERRDKRQANLKISVNQVEKMMRSQMKEGHRLGKDSPIVMASILETFLDYLIKSCEPVIKLDNLKATYEANKQLQVIDEQICGLDLLA